MEVINLKRLKNIRMKRVVGVKILMVVLSALLLTGCEKVFFDEEESDPQGNVIISVTGVEAYSNAGQTRTVKPLTEACSHL